VTWSPPARALPPGARARSGMSRWAAVARVLEGIASIGPSRVKASSRAVVPPREVSAKTSVSPSLAGTGRVCARISDFGTSSIAQSFTPRAPRRGLTRDLPSNSLWTRSARTTYGGALSAPPRSTASATRRSAASWALALRAEPWPRPALEVCGHAVDSSTSASPASRRQPLTGRPARRRAAERAREHGRDWRSSAAFSVRSASP